MITSTPKEHQEPPSSQLLYQQKALCAGPLLLSRVTWRDSHSLLDTVNNSFPSLTHELIDNSFSLGRNGWDLDLSKPPSEWWVWIRDPLTDNPSKLFFSGALKSLLIGIASGVIFYCISKVVYAIFNSTHKEEEVQQDERSIHDQINEKNRLQKQIFWEKVKVATVAIVTLITLPLLLSANIATLTATQTLFHTILNNAKLYAAQLRGRPAQQIHLTPEAFSKGTNQLYKSGLMTGLFLPLLAIDGVKMVIQSYKKIQECEAKLQLKRESLTNTLKQKGEQ